MTTQTATELIDTRLALRAAEKKIEELESQLRRLASTPIKPEVDHAIADMINAFLRWPLPESVSADGCATRPGKDRVGTNLLTCPEAMMMMQEVVRPRVEALLRDLGRATSEASLRSTP